MHSSPPVISTPARAVGWALLSAVLLVAPLFVVLPVVGYLEGSLGVSHALGLAAWSVVWGTLSIIGVFLAGRAAFGRWLSVTPAAVLFAALGIATSAHVNVAMYEWSVGRFGYYDLDFVRWTAGLFAVLIALAVATFGVHVAPRTALIWPAVAAAVAGVLSIVVIASNLPGLGDGIGADSWPLAFAIAGAAAYTALSLGAVARRAFGRRGMSVRGSDT